MCLCVVKWNLSCFLVMFKNVFMVLVKVVCFFSCFLCLFLLVMYFSKNVMNVMRRVFFNIFGLVLSIELKLNIVKIKVNIN